MTNGFRDDVVGAFAARLTAGEVLSLESQPLRGGLEAAVARFRAMCRKNRRTVTRTFVAKRLDGAARREAKAYSLIGRKSIRRLAPRLLGTDEVDAQTSYVYLEYLENASAWPWRDAAMTRSVVEHLAHLHRRGKALHEAVSDWDYEQHLLESATETVATAEPLARELGGVAALRRVVEKLPAARKQLHDHELAKTVIHGDAHTGNVMLRMRNGRPVPVLLDWGRARIGSPLEDVSSWLQSLGYWDPEIRRRHDSFLADYAAAAGMPRRITKSTREAYWIATASNALAGALKYHLLVAGETEGAQRDRAMHSARDCMRVIRRADAVLRA